MVEKTQDLPETALKKPSFVSQNHEGKWEISFSGAWHTKELESVEKDISAFLDQVKPNSKITVHIKDDISLDTAGIWMIERTLEHLKAKHVNVKEEISAKARKKLFQDIEPPPPAPAHETEESKVEEFINSTGKKAYDFYVLLSEFMNFFGHTLYSIYLIVAAHKKFRWRSIAMYIQRVGFEAVPIVTLISFLIGMVLAYQGINQLKQFGAEVYTANFLGVSILREIGVLLTTIVIAGRSGSSFAAQIGTMQLNQEIDALRILKLDPISVLVVPRFFAIVISLPLLVFWSDVIALFGGMIMMNLILDMGMDQYLTQLNQGISLSHFWVGMCKAPIFALLICIVGCHRGMKVRDSADSVGRMTTQAVVEALFLIIIVDAFMSILFSYLEI